MFSGESAFANFIADAFAVFIFILWFWLFITTASDLSRRRDVSGFGKVPWVILLIVPPYIGIFVYIITQGGGMAERNKARVLQARDELRQVVGFSIADELLKLDRLNREAPGAAAPLSQPGVQNPVGCARATPAPRAGF